MQKWLDSRRILIRFYPVRFLQPAAIPLPRNAHAHFHFTTEKQLLLPAGGGRGRRQAARGGGGWRVASGRVEKRPCLLPTRATQREFNFSTEQIILCGTVTVAK